MESRGPGCRLESRQPQATPLVAPRSHQAFQLSNPRPVKERAVHVVLFRSDLSIKNPIIELERHSTSLPDYPKIMSSVSTMLITAPGGCLKSWLDKWRCALLTSMAAAWE